jgi:hypothetical protein
MQDNYNAADAHNLVAIEKGRIYPTDNPQNKCLHARRRRAGSAKTWSYRIQSPSSDAYTQEYTVPGTSLKRTRRGSIGSGRLEDYPPAQPHPWLHRFTLLCPLWYQKSETLIPLFSNPSTLLGKVYRGP